MRLQVVGPGATPVFERKLTLTIPDSTGGPEPPMALEVFSAEVPIDGPAGKYRFLVTFEQGAAAAGGVAEFYVADPALLFVSVHALGAGRFVLNTLHIRDNLGSRPAADRLLLNMLRYAARDVKQPLAELPPDFSAQLKALGYQ